MFPLGLPSPLIQWENNNVPATTASAVKVTLRFPATGTPIFSWSEIVPELQTAPTPTLAAQPRATIPQTVWPDFQQTRRPQQRRDAAATRVFAIQRYVAGSSDAEVPTTIHFANGQLKGNIFYNSYGTNLVQNFGYTLNGASFGAATLAGRRQRHEPHGRRRLQRSDALGRRLPRVPQRCRRTARRILSNSYLTNGNSGGGSEATSFTYNPTLGRPRSSRGPRRLVGAGYGTQHFTYAALSPDGTYLFTSAAPASANGASASTRSAERHREQRARGPARCDARVLSRTPRMSRSTSTPATRARCRAPRRTASRSR